MNLQVFTAVYWKEMLELLRDRRTLISVVVLPLLFMPLLFSVTMTFMKSRTKKPESQGITVAIAGPASIGDAAPSLTCLGLKLVIKPDVARAVQDKQVATAVQRKTLPDGGVEFDVLENDTRQESQIAAGRVRAALEVYKTRVLANKLRSAGVPSRLLSSVAIETTNLASQDQMGKFFLGGIAGYLMLVVIFMGATHPAIDTAAGEKERRTIEALLASPANRIDIVVGKIAACATASFVSALLLLLSFVVSVRHSIEGLAPGKLSFQIDTRTIALLLLAVLPIALLGAAAMVAISAFAKSYKEGQSYIMPLYMAVIFPIIFGAFMNIDLPPSVALIPVLKYTPGNETGHGGNHIADCIFVVPGAELYLRGHCGRVRRQDLSHRERSISDVTGGNPPGTNASLSWPKYRVKDYCGAAYVAPLT